MSRARGTFLLCALLCAGAAVRLAYWGVAGRGYLSRAEGDEAYYEQGVALLSRGFYTVGLSDPVPRSWRGPVFPTFLALTELSFSTPWAHHPRLALQLLSLLAAALAYWMAADLSGRPAALTAAGFVALSPWQIATAAELDVHAFFGLMLLGLAAVAAAWVENPGRGRGLLLGATFAASLLTRSTHFLCVPAILALGAPRADGWRAAARRAAWPLLALAAGLIPWSARNALHFRQFQPLDAHSGAVNLYGASRGRVDTLTVEQARALAVDDIPDIEARFQEDSASVFPLLLAFARRRIMADPLLYLRGCVVRWWTLFGTRLLLFAAALFAAWRLGRGAAAVAAVMLSTWAYALVAIQNTYAYCLYPLAALAVALALAEALPERLRRTPPPPEERRFAKRLSLAFAGVLTVAAAAVPLAIAREAVLVRWPGRVPALASGARAEKLAVAFAAQEHPGRREQSLGLYYYSVPDRKDEGCAYLARARRAATGPALDKLLEDCRHSRSARPPAADGTPRPAAPAPSKDAAARHRRLEAALADAGGLTALSRLLGEPEFRGASPERAQLRATLAVAFWRRGADAAARRLLRAAMSEDPAACSLQGSLSRQALPAAYFDLCLERFPAQRHLRADQGVALWTAGRRAAAIAAWRAALSASPDDLPAALSLLAAGEPDAPGLLRRALAASKDPADAALRGAARDALRPPAR